MNNHLQGCSAHTVVCDEMALDNTNIKTMVIKQLSHDWDLPSLFKGSRWVGNRVSHIPKWKAKAKRKAARVARRKNR